VRRFCRVTLFFFPTGFPPLHNPWSPFSLRFPFFGLRCESAVFGLGLRKEGCVRILLIPPRMAVDFSFFSGIHVFLTESPP